MIAALLPTLLPVLGDLFRRWFPDPAEGASARYVIRRSLEKIAPQIAQAVRR